MIRKDSKAGEEFAGKPKKMSWERVAAFSGGPFNTRGWPRKNIHTDRETAKAAGLDTIYVSSTQYLGHLAELMIELFGSGWLHSGRTTNLKFIHPVADDDVIQIKARLGEIATDGTCALEVWCENQDGIQVMVGEASGRI
jgi:acyl dehydratase